MSTKGCKIMIGMTVAVVTETRERVNDLWSAGLRETHSKRLFNRQPPLRHTFTFPNNEVITIRLDSIEAVVSMSDEEWAEANE